MASTHPILGVNHVCIVAHDARSLARFYQDAAGLQPWPALAALPLPGSGLTLAGPNAGVRIASGGVAPVYRPVSEAGFTHLCFQTPAIDALRQAFADAQASFHCPLIDLGTGFLYCYARDPEHNVTELEGVAPVWREARPWIAHLNLACADIDVQSGFYAALLDHPAARSPRLRGDRRLDQIAGLDGVELRMAWVDAGNLQIELIHYSQPAQAATTSASSRRVAGACGHAYLALEVSSLVAAGEQLLACGGSLHENGDVLAAGMAFGADPEGNALLLIDHQLLWRHGAAHGQLPQPDITARFAAARAQLQRPT